MGGCLSSVSAPQHLIDQVDGDEDLYHQHYFEDQILGEGEFGIVRMVHAINNGGTNKSHGPSRQTDGTTTTITSYENQQPYACKVLRKGVVFKDNVIYSPMKPDVLRGEITMLRTLAGRKYCLKFYAIYESSRNLYMITEYCGGGQLMEYISYQHDTDISTEDISRIAYQLVSAIHHCSTNNIIHRDIKPENIMFKDPLPGSELRLIDFGSGVMDNNNNNNNNKISDNSNDLTNCQHRHTTFAGSAFYISPEMYQRDYDTRTDVWSVGVVLYVLVAGYPADCLQMAFNTLQKPHRCLRTDLPHMPTNLPDSFYNLLEKLLVYKDKKRPTTDDIIQHEFLLLHKQQSEEEPQLLSIAEISATAAGITTIDPSSPISSSSQQQQFSGSGKYGATNNNVSLKGSIIRHQSFLGYKKFERSLTTVLAAMLPKHDLDRLLELISTRTMMKHHQQNELDGEKMEEVNSSYPDTPEVITETSYINNNDSSLSPTKEQQQQQQQILSVCKVSELIDILKREFNNDEILETIAKIPNAVSYNNFAYHIELLIVFSSQETAQRIFLSGGEIDDNTGFSQQQRSLTKSSFRRVNSYTGKLSGAAGDVMTGSNNSTKSTASGRSISRRGVRWNRKSTTTGSATTNNINAGKKSNNNNTNRTVQGTNVFASSTNNSSTLKRRKYNNTKLKENTSTRSQ